MRGVLSSCGVALAAAALFGSAIVADPARARAEPLDAQAESLQRAIDDFVAYLRSESYDAAAEAARLAREHRDEIEAAGKAFNSRLSELAALLSDQKARADTLARDAMARLEAWSRSAGVSLDEAERLAHTMLDRLSAWLRSQVPSKDNEEIPV